MYIERIERLPEGWTAERLFWQYIRVRYAHPEKRVSISEFFIFEFYRLSPKERQAFLTDTEATLRMRPYNLEAKEVLWHKDRFLRTFSDFVSREWILLAEAGADGLRAFAEKHGCVALKPVSSSWGIGFRRLEATDVSDWDALFESLQEREYLAEAFMYPAPELARFHPASLNTLRVITFRNGRDFGVFGAGLRVGNRGLNVDNAHGGGIFCEIDPKTGVIITDGLDGWGNKYSAHPMTGEVFRGTRIPRWEEIIALCRRASEVLPFLRIVGWDVAILEDGRLELIEGNHNPGMNIVQAPARRGVKYRFDAMLYRYFGQLMGGEAV